MSNKTENPSVLRCLARLISLYELPRNSTILSKLILIKTILPMALYQKVLWMDPNQKILLMPSTKIILWITSTIYFMNDPQPNFYYDPKIFFKNGPYQTVSRMSLNKKIWIALNNRFLWIAPKFVDEWPQP